MRWNILFLPIFMEKRARLVYPNIPGSNYDQDYWESCWRIGKASDYGWYKYFNTLSKLAFPHFWRAKNLGQILRIPKNVLGYLNIMILGIHWWHFRWWCQRRGEILLFFHTQFLNGVQFEQLWPFCTGIYIFLQSFGGYGSKSNISAFLLGCTGNLHKNKVRAYNSPW